MVSVESANCFAVVSVFSPNCAKLMRRMRAENRHASITAVPTQCNKFRRKVADRGKPW